jgi:hypothetical protein
MVDEAQGMTAWHVPAAWRSGMALAAVCVLAACVAGPAVKSPPANEQPPSSPVATPLDASYDWRGLVVIPFGTLLKSSPIALHEVLLFHDDAHANSPELGKDCYTVDGKPPRFVDHEPEEFLLCFSHDRLDRIEASVSMKAGEGPAELARACALWLKNSPAALSRDSCEGHDGEVVFNAHLAVLAGDASAGAVAETAVDFQTQPSIFSMVLTQAGDGAVPATATGH